MRSDKVWAFRASNIDIAIFRWHLPRHLRILCYPARVSRPWVISQLVQSSFAKPCKVTFNAHAQDALRNLFRYQLFLFSKNCPFILKIIRTCLLKTHFFYLRVFHPNASSNYSTTITTAYRKLEQAKKREYAQRIRGVEHGVFTPLVFTTTGGMGREATTFYRKLYSRWNFY